MIFPLHVHASQKYIPDDSIVIGIFEFVSPMLTVFGTIKRNNVDIICAGLDRARRYNELRAKSQLSVYFGWDRLIVAADVVDGFFDWDLIREDIVAWLNDIPYPRAERINKARNERALPAPPQFALEIVSRAMWVLECDETISQGTAFDLEGFGVVTNNHVVSGATALLAFRTNNVALKFPVRVLKQHAALDLAIVELPGAAVLNALKPLLGTDDANATSTAAHPF